MMPEIGVGAVDSCTRAPPPAIPGRDTPYPFALEPGREDHLAFLP